MRIVKTLPRKGKASADHNDSIEDVLKSIDRQLRAHGLEIVQNEALSDTYEWVVGVRPKSEKP